MFIAGLGVGPTFAVFTLVVQNAVPFNILGVATSQPDVLPPDRRLGRPRDRRNRLRHGVLRTSCAVQVTAAGVPDQLVQGSARRRSSGQLDFSQLTGTGDLGTTILDSLPEADPAGRPAVHRELRARHPRGVQPRGRLRRSGSASGRRSSPPSPPPACRSWRSASTPGPGRSRGQGRADSGRRSRGGVDPSSQLRPAPAGIARRGLPCPGHACHRRPSGPNTDVSSPEIGDDVGRATIAGCPSITRALDRSPRRPLA